MIQEHSARESTHAFSVVSLKTEDSLISEEMITKHGKRTPILTSRNRLSNRITRGAWLSGELLSYGSGDSAQEIFNDAEFSALLSSDP